MQEQMNRRGTVGPSPYKRKMTKFSDGVSFAEDANGVIDEMDRHLKIEEEAKWQIYNREGEVCVDRLFNIRTRTMRHHDAKQRSQSQYQAGYSDGSMRLGN